MIVSDVKSKRYHVWADLFDEDQLGWTKVFETDSEEEAQTKAEWYKIAYYEDTYE